MPVSICFVHNRKLLERSTTEGDSPVDEMCGVLNCCIPEYGETREISSESVATMR